MFLYDRQSHIENIQEYKVDQPEFILNWIGQAGYVIKTASGKVVCLDPYYSNSVERYDGRSSRRMWYNAFLIENFRPDLVLCSHDHLDHTDPETLPLIHAFSDAIFAGPSSSVEHMKRMRITGERLKELRHDEEYCFEDMLYQPVFADHTEDSMGFVFKIEDVTVYFTGDTSLNERLFQRKDDHIDVLIACINGKYGNLTIEEAGVLYKDLGAKLLIPMHYGLIADNTVDINRFVRHCENEGINHLVMDVERNYYVSKRGDRIEIR